MLKKGDISKRRYLLEEIGIDGFKTDGGEFVWGRGVTAADGKKHKMVKNLLERFTFLIYNEEGIATTVFELLVHSSVSVTSVL